MSIEVMQETIAVQTERIGRGLIVLSDLRSHLALTKFHGPGNDWISTGDLHTWVQRLQDALTAEDVIRLGSSVVSYDSDRRYSGVRGTVVGFKRHEGCLRYRIAVKSRFVGTAEVGGRRAVH